MTPTVTFTFLNGSLKGNKYSFSKPGRRLIGRAYDCDIQVPRDYGHKDVSRHHCEVEIDPPTVRVRDLGSRNGTYVNGEIIGQRLEAEPDESSVNPHPPRELRAGDEIQIGDTAIRVGIIPEKDPNQPANPSAEIPWVVYPLP
jgi:pSer/pThr/pTyr-binding forkhead associated (FHA) protein